MTAEDTSNKRRLAPDFQPGPFDVICARGKAAHDHEGNVRFRRLVQEHQHAYANALTKFDKSQIVSFITNAVRQSSPNGGFVKLIKDAYYEVGDRAAKEKIGQTFRDLLHTKYTSSTKAKAKVRIKRRLEKGRSESPSDESMPPLETTQQLAKDTQFEVDPLLGSALIAQLAPNSNVALEDQAAKEWQNSLNLILDLPTLVGANPFQASNIQANSDGRGTELTKPLVASQNAGQNSKPIKVLEPSKFQGLGLNSDNQTSSEYLSGSLGNIRLQPSPFPNLTTETNILSNNGMATGNVMAQEPTFLGSSRLAFDQSMLFSSRNGPEALPATEVKATSVAPPTSNSFPHGFGDQMQQFKIADLEPVPLQEGLLGEMRANGPARQPQMDGCKGSL